MKSILGVRWYLTPMNDGNGNGTNQSLWTKAYRNLQTAIKVAQRSIRAENNTVMVLVI